MPLSSLICSTSQQTDGGKGCQAHPEKHTGGKTRARENASECSVCLMVQEIIKSFFLGGGIDRRAGLDSVWSIQS